MTLPILPTTGQTIGDSVVLQVFTDKYQAAQSELLQVQQALNAVIAEYSDLDSEPLEANELKHILALDGETAVRRYIAEKQMKRAGTVTLGGLKLSPEALAGMLAQSEVRQLAQAITRAKDNALYQARGNWSIADFIVLGSKTVPTEAAVNRVYNQFIVTGKSHKTKQLFTLVAQLAEIQNEINSLVKHSYLINADDLLTGDGEGKVIPFGGKILQRSGELASYY